MKTYKTSDIAGMMGVHPNTVRLYESLALIPKPLRKANGYRVFTDFHLQQFKLARLAFKVEVLQNGLRKKMVAMVKASARGEFDQARALAQEYLAQIHQEILGAREAITIVTGLIKGHINEEDSLFMYKRKEVSDLLRISMDTLRNWELNGLIAVGRKENGYRMYTNQDVQRLKVIRTLRCANYSLEAILNMLARLSQNPMADIEKALDTPKENTDIISVCDQLITSLTIAEENTRQVLQMLATMKNKFS